MRSIGQVLTDLKARDIRLWVEDESLRYSAPEGGLPPDVRSELKSRKGEILAFLKEAQQAVRDERPPIRPIPREGSATLSFAQQRLWFLDEFGEDKAAYNMPAPMALTGRLCPVALMQTLAEIVRRHELLRSIIEAVEGTPVTRPVSVDQAATRLVDLRRLEPSERETMRDALAGEDAERAFDLASRPALRLAIVQLDEERHALLDTKHHILSDGWSTGVYLRELDALYRAFIAGERSSLTELPIQYADFAQWQREWLQGERLAAQLGYWTDKLADARPLELPLKGVRPETQTYSADSVPLVVPAALIDRLSSLGHGSSHTLFMKFLAAFAVLLSRWSRQTDVVIGSPIANRTEQATEDLIGPFVNLLALRLDLSADPSFAELLEQAAGVSREAYAYQDLPFERLVEQLHPDRNLERPPVVQVVLAFHNAPMGPVRLPGLEAAPIEFRGQRVRFDLELQLYEAEGGVRGHFTYNTDLFAGAAMRRLADGFIRLLEAAAESPAAPVSCLPILNADERARLLAAGGSERREFAVAQTLHQWFESVAEQRPDAAAVTADRLVLTYGELNRRADRLAGALRIAEVERGRLVGLCCERNADMLTGILAILKTGAAYLPLDPNYPEERLAFMVEDAGLQVVVTATALRERAARFAGNRARLVDLNAQSAEAVADKRCGLPDDVAYVIYTSGSTGVPKGVPITHRQAVRLFHATKDQFQFDVGDVWTLFHSYAFDFSVWEIWGALLYGGRLVMVSDEVRRSPDLFARQLAAERVTVLNQTPSAFYQLSRTRLAGNATDASALRLVIFGGEALDCRRLKQWFERFGDRRPQLVNMYGITETTVHVTYRAITQADADGVGDIGSSLADLRLYLLDRRLEPTPMGVTGEIHVGGAGVGRGYLQRPKLSAERFVPDPHSGEPGARLYRTGDLARFNEAGQLQYEGRMDGQIQLRGYRVELGEIEARLRAHPLVEEAVVVAEAGSGGELRVIAYCVPPPGRKWEAGELRRFLGDTLPGYMIPSIFVSLDEVPRAPSGKVARRELPEVGPERPEAERDYVEPASPEQEILAGLWARVLELDRVGVTDDFFELGGHSLLATRLISAVREAFRVDIPLRCVFEHRTVERFAAALARYRDERRAAPPPILAGEGPSGPRRLSFAQQRLWFLEQLEAGTAAYNIPAALRLSGALQTSGLAQSLVEVARRHEVLRTSFPDTNGVPEQRIRAPEADALPLVDLSALNSHDRAGTLEALVGEASRRSFDLASEPLLRLRLLRLSAKEHALVKVMHHIVSDGWSIGVLVKELSSLYASLAIGHPSDLSELSLQYADFSRWQREWLTDAVMQRQLNYWRRQLEGLPTLELPAERPAAESPGVSGAIESLEMEPALVARLRKLSREFGGTLFMTLLGGFATLLHRYTNQRDLAVGAPIANRNHPEIEPLIGFFVNTQVLRLDLSGDPTFRHLLEHVRETALEAYAHQDLPFEQLVDELRPERNLGRNPLAQVLFVLQNAPVSELTLPGLRLSSLASDSGAVRFDLEAHLWETGDRLTCAFAYNTHLFSAAMIRRMMGHFLSLLEALTFDPAARVRTAAMLPNAEGRELRTLGLGDAVDLPAGMSLSGLFERRAVDNADAIAVAAGGPQLTCAALNARANRLARVLCQRGVQPGEVVAFHLDRGVDMIVTILGILKAGAAYMPLDPAYPMARLRRMMEVSGAKTLITSGGAADELGAVGGQHLDLGELANEMRAVDADDSSERLVTAGQLAYVMFTSGSTGEPKAIGIPHEAVVRLAYGADYVAPGAERSYLQMAPVAFDASTFEIWTPLLRGGRCVLFPDPKPSVEALGRCLSRFRIDTLWLTGSLFRLVVDSAPEILNGLKFLLAGGEALSPSHVKRVLRESPNLTLINGYGPTECTTFSCVQVMKETATLSPHGSVPIGRPIPQTAAYVLDPWLNPVPRGVPGELYVGGPGLALGYLGMTDLTAERFVPNPFADGAGSRLYRTGDRTRILADGSIEYLGRLDEQVKIRGFRIEPAEIESILKRHPAVIDALVVARDGAGTDKQLAAYVVPITTDESAEDVGLGDGHVDDWRLLYEQTYGERSAVVDPTFDIAGWNSSYTGDPIPAEEMREWVDGTVDRILRLRPQRVLEIGCGTGLLLSRIAPRCERYVGADFSAAALTNIAALREKRADLRHVEIRQCLADDVSAWAAGDFDLVVLNSTVQYFPGVDYLLRVVDGAVQLLADGGHLFVGDVRSLPLLEAFHLSVELHHATATTTRAELSQSVVQALHEEEELVIDPRFFSALRHRHARVSSVRIEPHMGRALNELTRFRYAAIIEVGGAAAATETNEIEWRDGSRLDALQLRDLLDGNAGEPVAVRQLRNPRLVLENLATGWLKGEGRTENVGQLRASRNGDGFAGPDDLQRIAGEAGRRVLISWLEGGADGTFDAVFLPSDADANEDRTWAAGFPPPEPGEDWRSYANDPLLKKAGRTLIPQLREALEEALPSYMIPADFMLLSALPMTPNGKVDRNALPTIAAAGTGGGGQQPRTPTEEILAAIWTETLGRDTIGTEDDFFAIGGHSLLATQMVSRIRDAFNIDLPLRTVFEHPTVAGLAGCLDVAGRGEAEAVPTEIRPADRGPSLPLSFAQQRLWFLDQLEGGGKTYNMPALLRLTGALQVAALGQALSGICLRHATLRTSFVEEGGVPAQVIAPPTGLTLPLIDLSRLSDEDREWVGRLTAEREAGRGFDLRRDLMLRGCLLRGAPEADQEPVHRLAVTMHHIASDGWSMGIFLRELSALYESDSRGEPAILPDLDIQYADFAAWQRRHVNEERLARQREYWRGQLADARQLELPASRPRPPMQSFRGEVIGFQISPELNRVVRALSRREGLTPFMTLLAGFATLLHRYHGQTDIVLGSPIANRNRSEIEELIGFFVNTLAMRVDASGNPSFRTLLRRVRAIALEAYANQDLPFEQLVEEIQPERDLSRNPLVQATFALQNAPLAPLDLTGLRIAPEATHSGAVRFDLEVHLWEVGDGLSGHCMYRSDVFDRDVMQRMLGHFATLLEGLVRSPDEAISRATLLPAEERLQLVREWNATDRSYARNRRIHEWLEEQAVRQPDAVAVHAVAGQLTYAKLNERANQVAHTLLQLDPGLRDRPIAVVLERSADLLIAIYGALKAGGCYVPVDPAYPQSRIAESLKSARAVAVVSADRWRARLPEEVNFVDIDGCHAASRGNPDVGGARDLAYVLFTSGSTGRPKGVMIEHHSVINRIAWMQRRYPLSTTDRILQKTTVTFDVSVWELFWWSAVGCSVVLPEAGAEKDPSAMAQALRRHNITTLHFVPSMLETFLNSVETEKAADCLLPVRRLFASGEALKPEHVHAFNRLRPAGSAAALTNLYGPTEATVDVSYFDCPRDESLAGVPIGRPIDNIQLYVLDPHGQPAPVGIPGELHIGGVGLARGYWDQPEETALRFVPDALSESLGGRLYKTGDLARIRADGNIEYIGRLDHQVKVRGFRIETQEIEGALMRLPQVREAAVKVDESSGEARLAAFVVPSVERLLPVPELPAAVGGGRVIHDLPNGLSVAHLSPVETEYIYREIFVDRCYLRHHVTLREGDCVFDVGAHIGLFSLFVGRELAEVELYAFEPLPPLFERLCWNLASHGVAARLFPHGLAECETEATFSFYPNAALMSGRYAEREEERALARAFLGSEDADAAGQVAPEMREELIAERLRSQPIACRLRPLSDVIDECGVERIDLLKIDVEKSELDVLRGIRPEHWPRIRQIALELRNADGRLEDTERLLRDQGFEVAHERESRLGETDVFNVFAVRPGMENRTSAARIETRDEGRGVDAIAQWRAEHVNQWQEVFDDGYHSAGAPADAAFNTATWKDSYTGEPIPEIEMREWVDRTVERIMEQRPTRVLEIGCGTGLLLAQIAPRVREFHGTDISPEAVAQVEGLIASVPGLENATVECRPAHDLSSLAGREFDVVVLNSVAQYFPNADYLRNLLRDVGALLVPGGSVFVGDVRRLGWLEAFHASVKWAQAEAELSRAELKRRVAGGVLREEELALEPAFFADFVEQEPAFCSASIEPKLGRHGNEMNRFRYQVVLRRADDPNEPTAVLDWRRWNHQGFDLAALERQLSDGGEEFIAVGGIPNGRLREAFRILDWMDQPQAAESTVGEMKPRLAADAESQILPDDLIELGRRHGYDVCLDCGEREPLDVLRAVFARAGATGRIEFPRSANSGGEMANNPLRNRVARQLIPELRRHLKNVLPEYMTPQAFVLLDALPLSANGKLDRRALAAPSAGLEGRYVAPRTETEAAIAAIWAEVLRLDRVGAHENFFDLGGHSLLATQVVSRLRSAFGVDLPLRRIFEVPTVAGLADSLAEADRTEAKIGATIPPADRRQPLVLSHNQQRLWFLQGFEGARSAYNVPITLGLDGALSVAALDQSLTDVLRRHEVLRSRYVAPDGQPTQEASPPVPVRLPLVDLGRLDEGDGERLIARLSRAIAARPFDLESEPSWRGRLLRRTGCRHAVALTLHHIASDAWSSSVLADELSAGYRQGLSGAPDDRPEPLIQYADYAAWQRRRLQGEMLRSLREYWLQTAGGLEPLELPTDRPRPSVQTFAGASELFQIPAEVAQAAARLAKDQQITPFMTFLAGFSVLLARYSGQRDVAVGAPIANREYPEVERLIGFFANTLVLRVSLDGDPTFKDLLEQVREVSLAAHERQDYPFERLVEDLSPARDLSRHPLVNVAFAFQNTPAGSLQLPGVELSPVEIGRETARFDLELYLWETEGSIAGRLVYNQDLFNGSTIRRFVRQYQTLLAELTAGMDRPVFDAALIDAEERRLILESWRGQRTEYPASRALPEIFAEQARARADAIALSFPGANGRELQVSYGALNERANRIAHTILEFGATPHEPVAMLLDRSVDLVATTLAILKSGGFYLPLDTEHPTERLRELLDEARVRVVVTLDDLTSRLPEKGKAVLCLDRDRDRIQKAPTVEPAGRARPDSPAYVNYTSGSTGAPKGVVASQRAVLRLVFATNYVRLDAGSRIAHASNVAFDAATFELWGALLHGGRLVGVPRETALEPAAYAGLLARQGVDTMFMTTALFNQMARESADAFARVDNLMVGGEAMDAASVGRVWDGRRPRLIQNIYGPTENTTFSTSHVIATRPPDGENVPIGVPISNSTAYILDERLRPTPPGTPGELYVGGDGLAIGYLQRPDLTGERFVPSPFGDLGERLYRTGDLATYRDDGAIVYLGRVDRQIKLRGFRIELEEIEVVLKTHPRVADCAVVILGRDEGRRLAAAVSLSGEAAVAELSRFLRQRLPAYMAPGEIRMVDQLPLTPTGKIDRRSVAADLAVAAPGSGDAAAPRTKSERFIADVWRDLLDGKNVGIDESFFEVGGHSLLLVRMQRRIEDQVGRELSIVDLFTYPTIRSLAAFLDADRTVKLTAAGRARDRVKSRQHALEQRRRKASRRRQMKSQRNG